MSKEQNLFEEVLEDVFSVVRSWNLTWSRPGKNTVKKLIRMLEEKMGSVVEDESSLALASVLLALCLARNLERNHETTRISAVEKKRAGRSKDPDRTENKSGRGRKEKA